MKVDRDNGLRRAGAERVLDASRRKLRSLGIEPSPAFLSVDPGTPAAIQAALYESFAKSNASPDTIAAYFKWCRSLAERL